MADREMIAATLAAGMLSAADFRDSKADPAEYAVTFCQKVLAALDKANAANRSAPEHGLFPRT